MTIYYSVEGAVNRPEIARAAADSIVVGRHEVCLSIVDLIRQHLARDEGSYLLALDGYLGIEWDHIVPEIVALLEEVEVKVIDISSCLRPPSEIDEMIALSVSCELHFGYVFEGELKQFFDPSKLEQLKEELTTWQAKSKGAVVLCYGSGAAIPSLRGLFDHIYYFDLTREELFNRSEEGPIFLLGSGARGKPVHQSLKRFCYVDSQLLNKHKKDILKYMDWYVDGNSTDELKLVPRGVYEEILTTVAQAPIMIKLLYSPVVWGGTWQKELKKLPEAMQNSGQGSLVPNENSIEIAVGDFSLEMPFLNLLWQEPTRIIGDRAFETSKGHFPLSYFYDDEIGDAGGHMAIQVHPDGAYMREHFNEPMRQDESYYILHTATGAKTYLGLQEGVNLDEFRQIAAKSEEDGVPIDHEQYVHGIRTESGDFLLIPAGIIHASGKNQVVIEIDWVATAYSPGYTFHIYDYMRPDLDGALRPIHIDRAFTMLKDRRTDWVLENLKQEPSLIREGAGWAEYSLGQRDDMLYEVHRLEFEKSIDDETEEKGTFHALTLVEGESVLVQSKENPDRQAKLDFPDTLIVPACMGRYTIISPGNKSCKVLKALVL